MKKRSKGPAKDFTVTLGPGVVLRGQDFLQDKLLLLATSRYGKSKQCRNIAEQCGKIMPIFVFDHEGEFKNLRSYIPIVIAGPDGEVPARAETASKLARRLVESNQRAVLDISELVLEEKRHFMRNFLVAMTELPRSLWGPRLMMFDEFQEYCPQVGDADGCRQVMNRYMVLCGKRGHGVVAATHRISKAHKDSIAVFTNVCVGRCTLDTDVARARGLLSFGKDRADEIKALLRGEFFAFGSSFEHEGVKKFRGGETHTHHPTTTAEKHTLKPPPPSATILKFARELKDLQKEADEEKDELETLRAEVKQLRAAASKRPSPAPTRTVSAPPAPKIDPAPYVLQGREDVCRMVAGDLVALEKQIQVASAAIAKLGRSTIDIQRVLRSVRPKPEQLKKAKAKADAVQRPRANGRDTATVATRPARTARAVREDGGSDLTGGPKRILTVLAQNPDGLDPISLRMFAQIGTKNSMRTYVGTLLARKYVERVSGKVRITDAGLRALGPYTALPQGRALVDYWLDWVGTGGPRRILEAAIEAGDEGVDKEDLLEVAAIGTSNSLRTYVGTLQAARLIETVRVDGRTRIKAAASLLEAAA